MPEVGRFYWGNHNDRTLMSSTFLGEITAMMTFSTGESVRQIQAGESALACADYCNLQVDRPRSLRALLVQITEALL